MGGELYSGSVLMKEILLEEIKWFSPISESSRLFLKISKLETTLFLRIFCYVINFTLPFENLSRPIDLENRILMSC